MHTAQLEHIFLKLTAMV